MRIAVDARELAPHPTGVGRYLLEILLAWAQDPAAADCDVTLYAPTDLDLASPRVARPRRAPASRRSFPEAAARRGNSCGCPSRCRAGRRPLRARLFRAPPGCDADRRHRARRVVLRPPGMVPAARRPPAALDVPASPPPTPPRCSRSRRSRRPRSCAGSASPPARVAGDAARRRAPGSAPADSARRADGAAPLVALRRHACSIAGTCPIWSAPSRRWPAPTRGPGW